MTNQDDDFPSVDVTYCKKHYGLWHHECGCDISEIEISEKEKAILKLCYPENQYMWAAKIMGIILECDFRDTKREYEKLFLNGDINE